MSSAPGGRARTFRVGLMIPSSNTMMEPDFLHGLPGWATLHSARMYMADTTPEAEARMLDEFAEPAARDLGSARPDVVVFGCTSAGALRGNAYDAELCRRISAITGVQTISTIQSVRQAIAATGASVVGVVTPYVDALNEKIQESVEADGVRVARIAGMGITDNFAIATVTPDSLSDFAAAAMQGCEIEALFASCTNLAGVAARPQLLERFGVPVVTSNQAVLEATLRALDELAGLRAAGGGG